MDAGTAAGQLRKTLLFYFAVRLNEDICFRCGQRIDEEKQFSIEHKVPWLHSENPKELFFDLSNISFSHLKCNLSSARKPHKYPTEEARKEARLKVRVKSGRKIYTKEKRRERYLRNGK